MNEAVVVSFIVVTYNGAKTIRETLRCLQAFTHTPYEIIVCDNASSDDTIQIITSEFPQVKIVKSTENLGSSAGNNLGASHASGRVLAFINPDLYVSEGWFEPLLSCLDSDPNFSTISPAIRHLAEPKEVIAIGNQMYLSGLTYLQRYVPLPNADAPVRITAFSGACYVIRRDDFIQVKGYSEDHFIYYEDTDLSIRLSMLGKKHIALPSVMVTHDYHPSFGSNKIYFLERNRYLTILTLLPMWALVILLPAIFLSELMIWAFCLIKGKAFLSTKARAWADVVKQKTWIKERRRTSRSAQTVNDVWLERLSPLINLQYLQKGLLSYIGEAVFFIIGLPAAGILRLVSLLNKQNRV